MQDTELQTVHKCWQERLVFVDCFCIPENVNGIIYNRSLCMCNKIVWIQRLENRHGTIIHGSESISGVVFML